MGIFKLILESRAQGLFPVPFPLALIGVTCLIHPIIYSHTPQKALKVSEVPTQSSESVWGSILQKYVTQASFWNEELMLESGEEEILSFRTEVFYKF